MDIAMALIGVVVIGVILNQMLLSRRIARLAEWYAAANNELINLRLIVLEPSKK